MEIVFVQPGTTHLRFKLPDWFSRDFDSTTVEEVKQLLYEHAPRIAQEQMWLNEYVYIDGLKKQTDMNGTWGRAVGITSSDNVTFRAIVIQVGTGRRVSVSVGNLRKFAPGDEVIICGLIYSASLNNTKGRIVDREVRSGRIAVLCTDGTEEGRTAALLRVNVHPVSVGECVATVDVY